MHPTIRTIIIAIILSLPGSWAGNALAQSPDTLVNPVKHKSTNIFVQPNPIVQVTISPGNGPGKTGNALKSSAGPGVQDWQRVQRCLACNSVGVVGKTAVTLGSITLTINTTGTTCGQSNGSIALVASGGTPPYRYSRPGWPEQQRGFFPELAAGSYHITVIDADGQTVVAIVSLSNTWSPPAARLFSVTHASGCSAADGRVVIQGVGGTPPYTYSMDYVNYQTSNTFTNLSAGFYTFFVKDANGCIAATLDFFPVGASNCNSSVGFTYSYSACNNEGDINVFASGTNAPYTYSLDGINFQSVGLFTNLPSGLYRVYTKDVNGDLTLFSIPIYQICRPLVVVVATDADCTLPNGTLTITASRGMPSYTYALDGVNFQANNVFTGLTPGNYTITVKDAAGTTNFSYATVYSNCPEISAVATHDNCGLTNGTVTLTGTKGTTPYLFSLDGINFQPGNVFTGLAAANYTATIKDANGFTGTTTVMVDAYCLMLSAVTQNVACSRSDGQITATATGGLAPYSFSIDGSNFQAGNIFTGLAAGTYTVTVQDATNAKTTTTATISDVPGPGISLSVSPASCNHHDASIVITAIGGTGPYQYSIDQVNFQSANTFSNLHEGTSYIATIRDANGCTDSRAVIPDLNCLALSATAIDATCGRSNGSILAMATTGIIPYSYSLDGINFQTNGQFTGLPAGPYTVTVKDGDGVVKTTDVTIDNICPTVTAIVVHETCDKANGTITATGANGTAPYQYSIDGNNFQSSNVFNGMSAGSYTILVKDVNALTNTTIVIVDNIPAPQLAVITTAASCSNNDGSITIIGSGGILPWQYSLNGGQFQSSNIFPGLANGNYTTLIKDANGCESSQPAIITLVNSLEIDPGGDLTICEGKDVTLGIISNGTAFTWMPSTGLSDTRVQHPVASPVVSTKYYITATKGPCIKRDSVMVLVDPAPIADAGDNETICFGQSVQLKGTGGLRFSWSPATYLSNAAIPDPVVIKPASTQTYHLQVTDINGCRSIQDATVQITVTPPATVFAGNDTVVAINQPVPLQAKDVNNSGFTIFEWSPGGGLNNPMIQRPEAIAGKSITYTVTARTPAGCEGIDRVNIKVYPGPEIYVPNAFSPNNDGRNDHLKPIPVGIREFKYFAIYNRWGQRIFYSSDPGNGWDGKTSKLEQGTNTFVWIAEGIDYNNNTLKRRGVVILIR